MSDSRPSCQSIRHPHFLPGIALSPRSRPRHRSRTVPLGHCPLVPGRHCLASVPNAGAMWALCAIRGALMPSHRRVTPSHGETPAGHPSFTVWRLRCRPPRPQQPSVTTLHRRGRQFGPLREPQRTHHRSLAMHHTRVRHTAGGLRAAQTHGQLIEDHCNVHNARPGQIQLSQNTGTPQTSTCANGGLSTRG